MLPTEPPKPRASCFPILLALGLALLVFAVLYVFTSGKIKYAAAAAGVIFGVAALHYVVWGWWLSGYIRRQVEEEQDQKR